MARFNFSIPTPPKRAISPEMIAQAYGSNPYASAIDKTSAALSQAMQKRYELRKQAQQVAKMESVLGLKPGEMEGFPLDVAATTGKAVAEGRRPTVVVVDQPDGTQRMVEIPAGKKFGGTIKHTDPSTTGSTIPRGTDPVTRETVYSNNRKAGLFFADGRTFNGQPAPLQLRPPSNEQVEKGVNLDTLAFHLNKVKENYSPRYTGAGQSLLGGMAQFTGIGAEDQRGDFITNLASIRNTILQLRSGAVITDGEARRLLEELPSSLRSDPDFQTRIRNFEGVLNQIVASRQERFGQAGYMTPGGGQQQMMLPPPTVGGRRATHRWNPATGKVETQ